MINSIVISRVNDTRRRARIASIMPAAFTWSFLDATDGHRPETIPRVYATLVPEHFWGGSRIKPGAFGCFVSHYRAWRACLDAGAPTLVLEDDAVFGSGALGSALDTVIGQTQFDVLFMNKRTVDWLWLYLAYRKTAFIPNRALRAFFAIRVARWREDGGAADVRVRSLPEIVEGIVQADILPPSHDTVGGECYLVTPNGARRLLERADRHGAAVGVDWFILGSGMPGSDIRGRWKFPGAVARCLAGEDPLNIGVTSRWLAAPEDREVGGSIIDHSRYADIREYGALVGIGDELSCRPAM